MFPKEADVRRPKILPSLKSFVTHNLELKPTDQLKYLPQNVE